MFDAQHKEMADMVWLSGSVGKTGQPKKPTPVLKAELVRETHSGSET